jgi:hypothetical protein
MFIAKKVWYELDSRDVRDVLKVGRLSDNFADVEPINNIGLKTPRVIFNQIIGY